LHNARLTLDPVKAMMLRTADLVERKPTVEVAKGLFIVRPPWSEPMT